MDTDNFGEKFRDDAFDETEEEKAEKQKNALSKKEIEIPYTYKLKYPIIWEDSSEPIDHLTIKRRLTVKEMMNLQPDKLKFGNYALWLSKLTLQPRALIEKIDSFDFMALLGVINIFLLGSQTTGEEE